VHRFAASTAIWPTPGQGKSGHENRHRAIDEILDLAAGKVRRNGQKPAPVDGCAAEVPEHYPHHEGGKESKRLFAEALSGVSASLRDKFFYSNASLLLPE
jgi:hypothetical protein